MTYGNLHRFLLRSVASRGVLTLDETQKIVDDLAETDTSVDNVVKEINEEIRILQQQIKITSDELTNEKVVVFMSTGYDEASKSQNIFSAKELEYFRQLIEEIMSTQSRQITGVHALNLVNKLKASFTKTDAQKLLNTWCCMRYLAKDDNNYALGVRAVHEFESYLRQNMPDTIEECFLCKQIVFRGYNCPACGLAVHTRCLNRYLEKIAKWPCCKADFSMSQLERLNADTSRLTQTQEVHETQHSAEYNTIVEPSQELSQDLEVAHELFGEELSQSPMLELSQETLAEVLPEVSRRPTTNQRAPETRKRKHDSIQNK